MDELERLRSELEKAQSIIAGLSAERDAYLQQRDVALGERNEFLRQRDLALRERANTQYQRDELIRQKSLTGDQGADWLLDAQQKIADLERQLSAAKQFEQKPSYQGDFLATWNKSVDFLTDPKFVSAYRRGMDSGHSIGRSCGSNLDIHIEWRVHTCCWAAAHARNLRGDFVECGVNTGIISLAVCEYVDFNATDKKFWLFDTFAGLPLEQLTDEERAAGREEEDKLYFECYDLAQRNFAPYARARLIRGRVPETFANVAIESVAYLSIDMNMVEPERAALQFFLAQTRAGRRCRPR